MDMSKYLGLFVSEAQEHMQSAARELSLVAQGIRSPEPVNALFRHFHSVKGMAASMGFAPIAELSHAAEDVLDRHRGTGGALDRQTLEMLVDVVDALADMIAGASRGEAGSLPGGESLSARIRACLEPLAPSVKAGMDPRQEIAAAAPLREAARHLAHDAPSDEQRSADPEAAPLRHACMLTIDPATELPGPRAALSLKSLARLGVIEDLAPPMDQLAGPAFDGRIAFTLVSHVTSEEVLAALQALPEVLNTTVTVAAMAPLPGAPSPEVSADGGEELPTTLRVPTSSLDRLFDGISEMIARRGILREALRGADRDAALASLDRLSESIEMMRDHVMTLRLLPFDQVVPRLNRAIRDVCRITGHSGRLDVVGGDVAMDRSVLEEVLDPLMHLIRNAVDHGIGSPAARRRRGKPVEGVIRIDVARRSDRIIIAVEDDGLGMDLGLIRRIAVQKGYATEADLARMSEDQVLMMTTIPGFSTAGAVTAVSGRGVGLDVVRTRIEALQGHMTIRSWSGRGTRIEMNLPPSLAVMDAFLVRSRDDVLAVPASSVAAVQQIRPEDIRPSHTGCYLPVDGIGEERSFIPLVALNEILSRRDGRRETTQASLAACRAPLSILTYDVNGTRGALAVDEIIGRVELVVKPLGAPLEQMRAYSGAALLNDGRVALVLDLTGAMELL